MAVGVGHREPRTCFGVVLKEHCKYPGFHRVEPLGKACERQQEIPAQMHLDIATALQAEKPGGLGRIPGDCNFHDIRQQASGLLGCSCDW